MRKMVTILGFLFFPALLKAQENAKSDSLLQLLQVAKEDTNKVLLFFAMAEEFENSEPARAKSYISLGYELSRKLNYATGILKSYRLFSYVNAYQSKFDSVIYYNMRVLEIARQKKDSFHIGVSLFNIGIGYRFMSDLENAIQYTLEGAKILEGKGHDNIESTINDGLQSLYMTLGQYDKAILYGEKAVELGRKLEDKGPLTNALSNLGLSYSELNRLAEARKLFAEALTIAESTNNKSIESVSLNNLSDIAIKENQFDLLKTYADRSIALSAALEDDGSLASAKVALAAYYLNSKEYNKAHDLAIEAFDLADKQNLLEGKSTALGMLSNIAFAMQDIKKGFDYGYQKSAFENKVFNESLQQKEAVIRIKYETEKKDVMIKLQKAELGRGKIINYILFGGAATLLIISILSYRTYRQKQKLQQQRIAELEAEKQLAATEAVLKGEEQERTRLAKDLHDGLGGMLSGIKYSFQTMKGNLVMTAENHQAFERSMDMLDSSIKEMRRVAHNMMPEALVKFGLDTALKDFCNDINQSGALNVSYQSIGLQEANIGQTTAITIYRIVQELINNTMKHAAAKTAIIQVSKTNNQLALTVEDDGKGFETKILNQSKARPDELVRQGIGWSNIQNRVEFLKGNIDIKSEKEKGTSVHIEISI